MTARPRSDVVAVERRSPESVFALLGDEIRVAILRGLGETPDRAVPFAELHRRVADDVPDSGQFNYHLGKLRDAFVRRTDEGYELTHAGRRIVGAMYAGTYTADATVEPFPVEERCPLCGGDIVAAYADETARLACTDCEEWRNEVPFPPGSLDQFPREELPAAFDRWTRHAFGGVLDGFCATCAGRVEGRLVVDGEERIAGMPAHAEYECTRCGSTARASGATPALFHPAFEGFLHDHGFDVRASPSWRLGSVALPETTLRSGDPPELEVRLTHDGETILAVVDADASVSGVERRPAGA